MKGLDIWRRLVPVLIIASALFPVWTTHGAVKPGENILVNGTFESDQAPCPPGWANYDRVRVKPIPAGGVDGKPYLRIKADTPPPEETSVRQYGIRLATNGLYRFSAFVRAKNFKLKNGGISLIRNGKKFDAGNIPGDTGGKWVRLWNTFRSFPEGNGAYAAVIYVAGYTGELDVADIKLEAIDPIALAGTVPSAESVAANTPRLIPFSPLLWNIPRERREIEFRFFGKTPSGSLDGYDLLLTAEGSSGETRVPLSSGPLFAKLPDGADHGVLAVSCVEKSSGKAICLEQFTYRVVDVPASAESIGRRRNNLCTELVSKRIADGGKPMKVSFLSPREGWLYIAVRASAEDGFKVLLDGKEAITRNSPRLETFREAAVGRHEILVEGASTGRLVVRAIADIYNYSPWQDWKSEDRHVLPAVTTENGGKIAPENLADFRKRGYRWIDNISTTGISAEMLERKLSESAGMNAPEFSGVSCDEQFFYRLADIKAYQQGLKAYDFRNSPERPIYTWIVGKPITPSQDHAFFATCVNSSRGKGKILLESYCHTPDTEKEAVEHLRRFIGGTLDTYRSWYPLSVPSALVALGIFNKVPVLSVYDNPDVDAKYFLDMQMNFVANNRSCRDLGAIGYWGSGYADEELRRWGFALMRHYVVQGNTNMLSSSYGYAYHPSHVRNGDFVDTIAPWRTAGKVWTETLPELGKRSQSRWGGGRGDTFAVLAHGGDGKPSMLMQTAKGLVPGRKYCFQFAVFDAKDARNRRVAPRKFAIGVKVGAGAKVDDGLSWTHVDERVKNRYAFNEGGARINLHHVVFTAIAAETEIALDTSACAPGEELGVNFVSLNPYFEGSAGEME